MRTPRLQIDLDKIYHNARSLVTQLGEKGIAVTGITKCSLGSPEIAMTMQRAGIKYIGDSRIENIVRMCTAGIHGKFVLIRSPQITKVNQVVTYADVSFNTEIMVIEKLSQAAVSQGKVHQVVVMVYLGDLREGILPEELDDTIQQCIELPGIHLLGIGTNLACLGGVKPNANKMDELSKIAEELEKKFDIKLEMISGGNSANFDWYNSSDDIGRINNLRLGESVFLGCETLNRRPIVGLNTDAITLTCDVIESKVKPSIPFGEIGQDAFGEHPKFQNKGLINHSILAIGRQDVLVTGIKPINDEIEIMGSSSDHIVVNSNNRLLKIGEEVSFLPDYGALLAAMTSPYVEKVYLPMRSL